MVSKKLHLDAPSEVSLQKIRQWIITGSSKNTYNHRNYNSVSELNEVFLYNACVHNSDRIETFLLEAIIEGVNKIPSIITLVVLSTDGVASKRVFHNMFNKIITNAKELLMFMFYCRSRRSFGSTIKHTVQKWFDNKNLNDLSREILENPSYGKWSMSNVLKFVRPHHINKQQEEIFSFIMNEDRVYDKFPIFNKIIELRKNSCNPIEAIRKYKLKNSMLPANIERTDIIRKELWNNFTPYEKIIFFEKYRQYFSSNPLESIFDKKLSCIELRSIFKETKSIEVKSAIEAILAEKNKHFILFDDSLSKERLVFKNLTEYDILCSFTNRMFGNQKIKDLYSQLEFLANNEIKNIIVFSNKEFPDFETRRLSEEFGIKIVFINFENQKNANGKNVHSIHWFNKTSERLIDFILR